MVANVTNGESGASVRSKINQIKDIAEGVDSDLDAHIAASDPHTQYLTESAATAGYQPLDSDLTSISALTTTSYGRGKLTLADAAAEKTALGINNIDNTSDANKPVSTATQTALNLKADKSDTINAQSGTTYTVTADDNGKVIECTNAAAVTVTVPNSLAVGFNCIVAQTGAGQVTIAAGASATQRAYGGSKTAGQWAEVAIRVRANAGGSAAEYVVSGGVA